VSDEGPEHIPDDDLEAVNGGATMIEYAVQLGDVDSDPPWQKE
jgi:hypothetical protein